MKNKKSFRIIIMSLLVLTLLLSACSSTATKPTTFPTGKFISSTDPNLVYEFNEDNTWAYYMGGLMSAKGTYRIEGNKWVEEGTKECNYEGAYTWTFDGKNLAFQLDGTDNCSPRKEATSGITFVLEEE